MRGLTSWRHPPGKTYSPDYKRGMSSHTTPAPALPRVGIRKRQTGQQRPRRPAGMAGEGHARVESSICYV